MKDLVEKKEKSLYYSVIGFKGMSRRYSVDLYTIKSISNGSLEIYSRLTNIRVAIFPTYLLVELVQD
jgi:hypothetical protein